MAAAALVVGIVVQRRQAARERAAHQLELRRISDAAAADLRGLKQEADRINREIASVQGQLLDAASAAERDRLRLQLQLQQAQLRANADRARAAAARLRDGATRTKHERDTIDLEVDRNNAMGGVQGK
ncbi:MAG: hypothetical protein IT370_15410 [Deltaproteobacteria bacterium]|nr:hypothetical protein [Deltaproteobacteria bacterium]